MQTAEVGAGFSFGEGSVLLDGVRSRTAVVVRDAVLLRVPPARFRSLMSTSPELAAWVARTLAARATYDERLPGPRGTGDATVLVPVGSASADAHFLAEALGRGSGSDARPSGPDRQSGRRPLVVADADDPDHLRNSIGQADRVVVVALVDQPRLDLHPIVAGLASSGDPLAQPPIELVLVHDEHEDLRRAGKHWSSDATFDHRHRIRRGNRADLERLARHLDGRSIGLVLGGGGARGMAHIGVIKALRELDIPIDAVGGSSIGAIIGGELAMGRDWAEILERFERTWASRAVRLDLSLPTVSVSSGRRARRILDSTFGDLDIADLPLEYFCTSVNLSRFRLEVHRTGPAAQWIRASASAPGLYPPVVGLDGELHIDGGQLNNVPTDVMRAAHPGPIIAVDLCSVAGPMRVRGGAEPAIGFGHLVRRSRRDRFPGLVDILNRCALLGSLQQQQTAADHADVYLTPDLSAIGFRGFGRLHEAVQIGYRATVAALSGGLPAATIPPTT